LHCGLDLIDRPAGDFAGFLVTALHYALSEPRHALRRARSIHVIVIPVGEEDGLVDVAIAVSPERIVPPVVPGPQREIEEIAIGKGPEQGADPADMEEIVMLHRRRADRGPAIVARFMVSFAVAYGGNRNKRCHLHHDSVRGGLPNL
jgi:hypothetical protein